MEDCGFLFCATGAKYLDEAAASAAFFRETDPEAKLCIYTELVAEAEQSGLFDVVVPCSNPQHSFFDKINAMLESPYERTVFLDTDTRVILRINDLFGILGRFPLAICHAPKQRHRLMAGGFDETYPEAFPQLNSGVIAYRRDASVVNLFNDWKRRYEEGRSKFSTDQGSLTQALWDGDLPFYILPPEYNFRPHQVAIKNAFSSVKVIHSRWLIGQGDDMVRDFAKHINDFAQHVSWVPTSGLISKLPVQWRRFLPKKLDQIHVYQSEETIK